jgi:pimeloyl-ACP methyl ester carboxylesterase
MPTAVVNGGIQLEYETFGSPDDPALLLIMGFSAQMTDWPEAFCQRLAEHGRYVIRFDNRDCGLSSKFDGIGVDAEDVMIAALADTEVPAVPYNLSDMASDAVGLLDYLGIGQAHIVGASMGGMVAQHVAIEHPERTLSLVSIMSTTGEPEVGAASPEAIAALLTPAPVGRDAYIDASASWATWQSKKYVDLAANRERAAHNYDRSFYPEGSPRQLCAIYASGRRTTSLRTVTAPTLVIHGRDDALITWSGGARTAELVPGANFLLVADMGHDLPLPLWPILLGAIDTHATAAEQRVAAQSLAS